MSKFDSGIKIRLVLKKDYLIESLFVFYLLLMGLLSGYFCTNAFWFAGLIGFDTLLLISKSKNRQEIGSALFKNTSFYAVTFLGCASIALGSSNQYLLYNLKWWLQVLLVLLGVVVLDSNSKYDFRSVLKSYFYLLNIFWMANLIIVSIQCTGNGFMIKQEWLAANGFYKDHCSGLFGAGGTHKLSLFTAFMTIYNLSFAREISSNYQRKGMYLYIFATAVWMLYISTLNDNKTLFVLLPVWVLTYYIMHATNETIMKNLSRFVKMIPIALLLVMALLVIVNSVPILTSFIQDNVRESATKFATLGQSGTRGSIERITIATDAIEAGYGLLFGKGLGTAAASERISGSFLGYRHFSMSSIGTLVTLGGVWFYLSACLFYTHFFYRFIKSSKKSIIRWLLCLLIIMSLTMYTPILEAPISMLWTCLTFTVIGNKDAASGT